eukprot:scaffold12460_cov128-Skeletonema_marinoi.AAC.7
MFEELLHTFLVSLQDESRVYIHSNIVLLHHLVALAKSDDTLNKDTALLKESEDAERELHRKKRRSTSSSSSSSSSSSKSSKSKSHKSCKSYTSSSSSSSSKSSKSCWTSSTSSSHDHHKKHKKRHGRGRRNSRSGGRRLRGLRYLVDEGEKLEMIEEDNGQELSDETTIDY